MISSHPWSRHHPASEPDLYYRHWRSPVFSPFDRKEYLFIHNTISSYFASQSIFSFQAGKKNNQLYHRSESLGSPSLDRFSFLEQNQYKLNLLEIWELFKDEPIHTLEHLGSASGSWKGCRFGHAWYWGGWTWQKSLCVSWMGWKELPPSSAPQAGQRACWGWGLPSKWQFKILDHFLPFIKQLPRLQRSSPHLHWQGTDFSSQALPTGGQFTQKSSYVMWEKSKEAATPALSTRITEPTSTTPPYAFISFKLFIWQTVNNNMQGINSRLKHTPNILFCVVSKVICMFTGNTDHTKQKGHSLCLNKLVDLFSSIIKAWKPKQKILSGAWQVSAF